MVRPVGSPLKRKRPDEPAFAAGQETRSSLKRKSYITRLDNYQYTVHTVRLPASFALLDHLPVSEQRARGKAPTLELSFADGKTHTSLPTFVADTLKRLAVALGLVPVPQQEGDFGSVDLTDALLSSLEAVPNTCEYRDRVQRWFYATGRKQVVPYIRNVDLHSLPGGQGEKVMEQLAALPTWGVEADGNLLRLHADRRCTGIVVPWLYIGSCGSAFGLHLEDCAFDGVNCMVPLAPGHRHLTSLQERCLRIYNALSFKRWLVHQGSEEQLLRLQGEVERSYGLCESSSMETINRRCMLLEPSWAAQRGEWRMVDQLPGQMVVVAGAHMGFGVGGCNVSWNACGPKRLAAAAEFLARHHARLRAATAATVDSLADLHMAVAETMADPALPALLQPSFSVPDFIALVLRVHKARGLLSSDEAVALSDALRTLGGRQELASVQGMVAGVVEEPQTEEVVHCDACQQQVDVAYLEVQRPAEGTGAGPKPRAVELCPSCAAALMGRGWLVGEQLQLVLLTGAEQDNVSSQNAHL